MWGKASVALNQVDVLLLETATKEPASKHASATIATTQVEPNEGADHE